MLMSNKRKSRSSTSPSNIGVSVDAFAVFIDGSEIETQDETLRLLVSIATAYNSLRRVTEIGAYSPAAESAVRTGLVRAWGAALHLRATCTGALDTRFLTRYGRVQYGEDK